LLVSNKRSEVTRPKPGLKLTIVKWHGCHALTENLLQQFKVTPRLGHYQY